MTETHADHPYHMVEPSPWPFIGSASALVLAFGSVLYLHDGGAWLMVLGFGAVAATMFGWWRQVIREAQDGRSHGVVVRIGLRYGMALFIASEVMFFAAFFWAFFNAALFPTEAMGGIWPPEGIKTFNPWDLPFLNTLILLTSGVTLTWSHHALIHDDRRNAIRGLVLTIILAVIFTAVQAIEYSHAAFGLSDGIYPSVFYLATGFHGFHVIVGTIFLTVCLFRLMKGHFTPTHHVGFEAAAWYWHFVDVVWLFLFFAVYWWGA